MQSVSTDVFPPTDGGHDDLILLPANGQGRTFGLDTEDDGAQVELAARDDDEVPYDLRVTHDGTPLHQAAVSEEFFDAGLERERFTTVAGRRLAGVTAVSEDAATAALADVLENIRDHLAADGVHIIDGETRALVEKTVAVTYSPNGEGSLVVTFNDVDFNGADFTFFRSQMTIPARQWADTTSAPTLRVQGVQRVFNGSEGRARWRTVRRIWMAMATSGDAPPRQVPVTADDLRSRGTVPQIGVDVDAVEQAVRENRKFKQVREELGVSRSNEKTLHTALERLGLGDDVDYGMVKP